MTPNSDRSVRARAERYVSRKDGELSVPQVLGALAIEPTDENVATVRGVLEREGDR